MRSKRVRPLARHLLLGGAILCSSGFATTAAEGDRPSIDEVIERHIEARGGRAALDAITTLVRSQGLYREPGYEGSGQAFMAHKRPYMKVVGNPEAPGGFMEGYDGAAWEWFADPGIVIRTVGEANAAARHGAYLDGTLVDWRERGSKAELGELVSIGGRPAWRVTITARDSFRRDYFIDAESWLITAERMAAPIHAYGEPVERETRVGDYRRIAGVLFPFHFAETDIATGEMVSEMRWGSIEANRDLPDWWFSPPPYPGRPVDRTPLQRFLEHLYFERTDGEAMMWTYEEFRRVHPEIDTRDGVELIGYQMLKMGDVASGVQLLEANARDYPDEASAAFSLGRALEAAEQPDEARREYERALALDPEHRGARRALRD